jgi:hypothetical protein
MIVRYAVANFLPLERLQFTPQVHHLTEFVALFENISQII